MKVFHYPIEPQEGWQEVEMPEVAQILFMGYRGDGSLRVWAKVPILDEHPTQMRELAVLGTGWDVPSGAQYVNSVIHSSGLVWHLFRSW